MNQPDPRSSDDSLGCEIASLDTPALLLDEQACRRNLQRMASFFRDRPAQLRPHFKNHKCTTLARRQLQAGSAVGMTCAHLGEAEALAAAGIPDILIANQVVGSGKLRRLAELAKRSRMAVAVDDVGQAQALSQVAAEHGATIGLLLEVDIGMGRCGVAPGQPALQLARRLVDLPGTQFRGLQAYEGQAVYLEDPHQRAEQSRQAMRLAQKTAQLLREHGIAVDTLSGSSSATHRVSGTMRDVTEIQAGTYATLDWKYQTLLPDYEIALSVLSTVISRAPDRIVLDVGVKSVGSEFGVPRIKDAPGVEIPFFRAEEHCVVRNAPDWPVGTTVQVLPSHACTTCNLHRQIHVHREGLVVDIWPIDGAA